MIVNRLRSNFTTTPCQIWKERRSIQETIEVLTSTAIGLTLTTISIITDQIRKK